MSLIVLFGFVEENHFMCSILLKKIILTGKCISGYFFLMNTSELQIGSNLALEFYNSVVLFYYFRIQFITYIFVGFFFIFYFLFILPKE